MLRRLVLSTTESGERLEEEGRMEHGEKQACNGDHPGS